jgi:hypothetical protein
MVDYDCPPLASEPTGNHPLDADCHNTQQLRDLPPCEPSLSAFIVDDLWSLPSPLLRMILDRPSAALS